MFDTTRNIALNWTAPTPEILFKLIDCTWPAAKSWQSGNWTIRDGAGGGQRVSAATWNGGPVDRSDVINACDTMSEFGQKPLFMVRTGESELDEVLASHRLAVKDPVNLYACPSERLANLDIPDMSAIPCSEVISRQREIWANGGIGPARIAVMERAVDPKTYILGRIKDRPTGTAFVAADEGVAMLHALEVLPEFRRSGSGRAITVGAARWALRNGATSFSLMTTAENDAANTLYQRLGMTHIAAYHYRVAHAG